MSPTVGEQLKRARIARQLSFKDVAKDTKIQPWVLEALEAGQLHAAMSPVYVRGFLLTYAKFLNLDPRPLLEQLFPVQAPEASSSADEAPALTASRLWEALQPVVQRLGRIAVGAACVLLLVKTSPWRWVATRMPHREASLSISEPHASPPPERALALQPAQPLELVLIARRSTWVLVKADGRLLAQQQLLAGAQETWTARQRFELVIAAPSQVEVQLNGRSISPLAMANHGRLMITHENIQALPATAPAPQSAPRRNRSSR